MTHEEFVGMVGRLEEFARREPSKYALRVGLLAALGYAYLVGVLAAALLLVGALVYLGRLNFAVVKVGWLLLAFAALVVRAMWVRIPPPVGAPLTPAEAPRLFELVEELTARLDAPRIHRVLINGDFNAGVSQVPRLGPLGLHRNYLVLGLPLMQALSPGQFRAVLAHELGHLSGNHGRFSSRIYGVRVMWFQLLARLEAEGRWGSFVFTKFFNWYAPYFNAYSFVLARQHEYDADRAAAEVTSPQTAAGALVTVDVKAARLSEEFWPEVFKRADEQREPERGAYVRMSSFLREALPEEAVAGLLRRSLAQETGYGDTHPSLAARLAALGVVPANGPAAAAEWAARHQAEPLRESAAMHFLGPSHQSFAERLDAEWFEAVTPHWRERHEYAVESRRKLAALDEKAASGPLTPDELWERAYWTAELKGAEEAEPRLREVLERRPNHAAANYALGQMLLARGDESGVAHVERAMEAEPDGVPAGCELIYAFLRERGRIEEAGEYRNRFLKHFDLVESAQDERNHFRDGDRLLPHGLGEEEVARLREQLRGYEGVKAAYLARKAVEHFANKPVYVLAVETDAACYDYHTDADDAELLQSLSTRMEMPGESFFVILDRNFRKTKKALQAMDGALVYGG
ncbi:MAG TPA: M48 family metalloprotease [Pyrinomonadaceae bacterium]|nr:M48 family metalloprotease [Pyrinomonadaceae bacterium]